MSLPKRLFLLDAMALIYRAYFALNKNPRINSKGLNTSAILGFTNTLYEILKNEKPSHIAVAIDSQAPNIRVADFTGYKAHREAQPEDITKSLPYILRLIEAFNIPLLAMDGYEADDIIGTLAKQAEKEHFTVYIMSTDKDFGQLVSDKILQYKPARAGNKPEIMGVHEVCEKYGLERTEQLIDLLGLWGDASDNIPGIPGVGEVKAKQLISQFGSIENMYENLDKLSGKLKETVEQNRDKAMMSKSLATIILDVPVSFHEESFRLTDPDFPALKALFDELEFRNITKRIFDDYHVQVNDITPPSDSNQFDLFGTPDEDNIPAPSIDIKSMRNLKTTPHHYILVDNQEKIHHLLKELSHHKFFCFDTETTGLDTKTAELVGISFSFIPGEAYFVYLPDNRHEALKVTELFKPFFEDDSIQKIGQNLKFDISMMKAYGVEVRGKLFDTMLAHYLLEPDMRHNMDLLSETYLGYAPVPYESLVGKTKDSLMTIRTVDKETLKDYSCEDADVTLQLKNSFEPLLQQSHTKKLFEEIEIPLIQVLSSMEFEGVRVDKEILDDYSHKLTGEISTLEKMITHLAGKSFNIASPKQLGEILFDHLKIIEKPKLTKTKQYSTGEEELLKLYDKHEIIPLILEHRELSKLKSTYIDALPRLINPKTGRIHTSYNQAVASTGRLSSTNPNLQNIPIRTDKGREIRKAFVPRDNDYVLLSADYSQVELRIIASLSGETHMIHDLHQGLDIHTATAARIYGVDVNHVTPEQRRNAKTVNFGIIYGISAFGLSERLHIPRSEASDIINQYFEKYPAVKKFMDSSIESARKHGYVETIMGRRRYIRDINSDNKTVRGFAERNAINAPIQGSAADMIKVAMINIYHEMNKHNLKSRMILQVHDELVFDTFHSETDFLKELVLDKMKNAIKLDVPIDVAIGVGSNWLEAH